MKLLVGDDVQLRDYRSAKIVKEMSYVLVCKVHDHVNAKGTNVMALFKDGRYRKDGQDHDCDIVARV